MSRLTITDAKGRPHDVFIEFDERRSMWRFQGLGFDFWAMPVCADFDPFADSPQDVERECFQADVRRTGDESGRTVRVSIACPPSGELTEDLVVSKCLKELGRFWDLFGELEDAE